MTDDSTAIAKELARAEAALRGFAQGPAQRAADDVAAAFERAGERMAKAMGQAAQGGEGALKGMVKTALEELARLAIDRISGGAPAQSRQPSSQGLQSNGHIAVHFHLSPGAQASDLRRHDSQIATLVARAAAYGRKNL